MSYHQSVLLNESVEILSIKPNGVYVDLTFGGGGHSRAILNQLNEDGRLIAVDQDEHAFQNKIDDDRVSYIHANFEHARKYIMAMGYTGIDGTLADLGVSSFQLDNDDSGFSYRENIKLDMRMNQQNPSAKASDILNTYTVQDLQSVFQRYGEVRNARSLAMKIVESRDKTPFEYSNQLNEILDAIKFGPFESYAAPVYQALRMEVNKEMEVLETMMSEMAKIILPEGVMAIISFHSLEDRAVKNFMKYGDIHGAPPSDLFGHRPKWPWHVLTKKPIGASTDEIKKNARSRSAKLRAMKRKHE